jgi:catechol 2,3-dioxygenase-like lactoylglutathione lyase family enzyme
VQHTDPETWPISDPTWRAFAEQFAEQWKIAHRRHLRDGVLVGVDHLGLTVQDVERSARWYQDVLGFEPVGRLGTPDGPRQKIFLRHPDLAIRLGLVQHRDGAKHRFDETHTGLDHLAFAVPTPAALRHWCSLLRQHGVVYSPIAAAHSIPGAEVIVFRDPDNIQLELFARHG